MSNKLNDNVYNEMLLQDVIKNRKIHINDDFTEVSMFKVRYYMEKIKRIDDMEDITYGERLPIELVINSYGGSTYELLGTLGLIEQFKNEYKYDIITTCTGKAMSCGAILLTFGTKRRIYKYSTVLIHKISNGSYGNYDQLEKFHEENVRVQELVEKMIVENTKIPIEVLKDKTKGVNWTLSTEECLKYGVVDEILG